MHVLLAALVLMALVIPPACWAQSPPAQPPELTTAPTAPKQVPETPTPGEKHSSANVCEELLAYLRQAEAGKAQSGAGGGGTSTEAAGQRGAQSSSAGPGQTAPRVDTPQQQSGLQAPIPNPSQGTPPSRISIEQAQGLANANDQRGCQQATRQMRLAGVALPPSLLALAALREDLLAQPGR